MQPVTTRSDSGLPLTDSCLSRLTDGQRCPYRRAIGTRPPSFVAPSLSDEDGVYPGPSSAGRGSPVIHAGPRQLPLCVT